MGPKAEYQKFKKHLKSGGLFYALWRGIKYFIFLSKRTKERRRIRKYTFKITPETIISRGRTRIVCSGYKLKILRSDAEVTGPQGLKVSINARGLWADSSLAYWKILERGSDYFKARVILPDLPLTQIWSMAIKGECLIDWRIEMQVEERIRLDELRISCWLNPLHKTWVSNYQQGDFPRLTENQRDLYLSNVPVSLLGARFSMEGKYLPAILVETREKNFFGFIENSSSSCGAHIISFRRIIPKGENDYPKGRHHIFSGTINLFEDERSLDSRIEDLRRGSLGMVATQRREREEPQDKVLLINLPWQGYGRWGVRAGSRWPHIKDEKEEAYLPFPFFLAYATALLEKHGIASRMVDAIADEIPEDKFLGIISKMKADYLVAETSVPSFYDDLRMLKDLSRPGRRIILCGPNTQIYKPEFLRENPFIDFVIYGEYEFTLLDLIQSLEQGRDLYGVKGLIYRNNATCLKNPKREPFDINLLPWPHREGLPMHKYLDAPGDLAAPSVQVMASRGCPFKCQFCLWPQVLYQGNHYRARNVIDVVDEMEYLVKEKGFRSVYFDDDTFNIGKERMLDFCREIIKRGLNKVEWAIMARPDLMDEEILRNMKAAGLQAVKYGVESATQGLVDAAGKGMDLKKAEEMIRLTQKLGIKVHLTFTFGLPGETAETIEKTISYVRKLKPFSAQFSITTPFPGTKYYQTLERNNLIVSRDFSLYDGQSKSVIKLPGLSPENLEEARERAQKVWEELLRKRRGFWGNIKRFYYYFRNYGMGKACAKAGQYIKKAPALACPKPDSSSAADLLLIQCPPWDITMPPLGIAYLSSYLKGYGLNVSAFDLNVALYNSLTTKVGHLWEQKSYDSWIEEDSFKKNWLQLKEPAARCLEETLKKVNAPFIGLSVNSTGIRATVELLRIIKRLKNESKIILGGWGCITEEMRSRFPREIVDVFVVGEGEETLREVIGALRGNKGMAEVPGAIFNNGRRPEYKPRLPIKDLNSIPWPTFDEFCLDQYRNPILPILGSRGCISNCSFCNDWFLSRPYRFRSAENIFEEIKYHIVNNGVRGFGFKDLLCNGSINMLDSLSNLIINSGLEISWDSQAIPRKEMTYELLCKLKRSGCTALIYGIESFSDNVLRNMRKIFTKEVAERVLRDTHRAGIKVLLNIIVGFPGETEEDFRETFEAIKSNRKYISQIGAISVCLVNNDCDLEKSFQRYGLVLSEDPRIRPIKWQTADGKNTYEVRRRRADRIIELVEGLRLSYETRTI